MKNTCIVLTGPTAIGKTAVAIQLASHFTTQIISADSRQCFKELNIGVAKPSFEELQSVQHHFINSHSIHDTVNAAVFEKYAMDKVQHIFAGSNVAVMVGGTGLYIKAFCSGLDEVPVIPAGIRQKITSDFIDEGLAWLQQEVKKHDPIYYAEGEIQNPQRLMRALEVKLSTGKSIVEFQTHTKTLRDFDIIKIGFELPRAELYQRINNRVEAMMEQGLTAEAKGLEQYQHLNALQTVGYKELFGHFNAITSLPVAVEAIKQNTRQYAKRQMTWFKKDKEIKWCEPELKEVLSFTDNLGDG